MSPAQASRLALFLALLLALAGTATTGAGAQVRVDRAGAARRLGYAGPPDFSHRRHRELDCGSCHDSGERHGALVVKTLRDCQGCHHAPARQAACGTCHADRTIRGVRRVAAAMTLSVWRVPRERRLPFAHERHVDVACTACHTVPVTLAPARACESCHEPHHSVETTCRNCHESPREVHTREAHLGCAGSGCHTLAGTVALTPVRNVCLTCHQTLVNHNPGRECARCHQVDWNPTAPNPARRASLTRAGAP